MEINSLKKNLFTYSYPQYLFASRIKHFLKKLNRPLEIIDIPCGTGEISYHLSKILHAAVFGYDIDGKKIALCNKLFRGKNLHYERQDIFQVLEQKSFDVLCIINSLFLLPDTDKLINLISEKVKGDNYLIVVIPNIKSENYKIFQKENAGINIFEKTPEELIMIFESKGLKNISSHGIGYSKIYGRKFLQIFGPFKFIYHHIENFIQKPFKEPIYYLMVFNK